MTASITDDYEFDYPLLNMTAYDMQPDNEKKQYLHTIRLLYLCGYCIICTLGMVLNFLVIIASCYHQRKSDTAKWVLALAITHFIFSAFLPLQILYSWYHFNWHYGTSLCKLSSYVFYASLFSTASIMTLWGVTDRIDRNKWQGKCCEMLCRSSTLIMILCSWTYAVILSIPSLYSRELRNTNMGVQCIDDYDTNDDVETNEGKMYFTIVVWYRFILGIMIPAFLLFICYCWQRHAMEKNLKHITLLIKLAYFVCWTPLLIMGVTQAVINDFESPPYGLPAATVLAAAHCCINPVIYLLVNNDIKMKWMNPSVL